VGAACTRATAAFGTRPPAVLTPAASAASALTAAAGPRVASSTAYGSVTLVNA